MHRPWTFHNAPANRRRPVLSAAICVCAFSTAVFASAPAPSGEALGLNEAAELALQHQPLLDGLDAQVRAAREGSVAAAQLPDPQLFGGIRDLPINTQDAFSLSDDSDTQLVIGVSQEFPRAAKRRLRGEQRVRAAQRLEAEQQLVTLAVRRDASLAWLALWRDEAAQRIAAETLDAAQLQAQAAAIAVRANSIPQSDYIAALVSVDRLRDAVAARAQAADQSRLELERWIGEAARRPVALQLPTLGTPQAATAVLDHLAEHPELAVLERRINESQTDVDLAKAARQPDWRVEFGYGYRREYSDMVMLQVGMDLPLFAHDRQDRNLASAMAQGEAAAAQWEDGKRRLTTRVLQADRDLARLTERLAMYNDTIEPQTNLGIEFALAAWRSGRATMGQVLEARRVRLEVLIARLDLEYDALVRRVELNYLSGG